MHEMSLALAIRDICERELAGEGNARLTAVGIDVGAFAGVEVDALRFGLEVVLGERFEGVRVEIRRVPGTAVCPRCGSAFRVISAPFECPGCGIPARGVSGGEELRVNYLDLE